RLRGHPGRVGGVEQGRPPGRGQGGPGPRHRTLRRRWLPLRVSTDYHVKDIACRIGRRLLNRRTVRLLATGGALPSPVHASQRTGLADSPEPISGRVVASRPSVTWRLLSTP